MILVAAAQAQTDTSGSVVTGIFTLAAALVAGSGGLVGGWRLQRWREQSDRETRAAAPQQVRDELQREALLHLLDATTSWVSAVGHVLNAAVTRLGSVRNVSEHVPGMVGSSAFDRGLEFEKVLPRLKDENVRSAAVAFQKRVLEATDRARSVTKAEEAQRELDGVIGEQRRLLEAVRDQLRQYL